MSIEIKIKVKSLFAKAVNSGMTPDEAYSFFKQILKEYSGKNIETKKIDSANYRF